MTSSICLQPPTSLMPVMSNVPLYRLFPVYGLQVHDAYHDITFVGPNTSVPYVEMIFHIT